ncbi:hypothetical protein BpHYR1_032810 [Brachionus plicatilis]|uniref:Uncharacterized protein n=1 Tax=Brachionus plicatilis TaxID=10195 RepID=A0A3M7SGT0_BRAPC|nr:hypothetical protein BpHYR1_032810 [Brachionus plicatilis]
MGCNYSDCCDYGYFQDLNGYHYDYYNQYPYFSYYESLFYGMRPSIHQFGPGNSFSSRSYSGGRHIYSGSYSGGSGSFFGGDGDSGGGDGGDSGGGDGGDSGGGDGGDSGGGGSE